MRIVGRSGLAIVLALGAGVGAGVAAVEGVATDYWGRVIAGVWFTSADGDFSADADGLEGETFDTADFDLDSYEAAIMIEASLRLPVLVDLHAGVFSYSSDGSDDLGTGSDFDGQTFQGDVTADLAVTDFYVEAGWRPIETDIAGASLGLAVHYIDAQVELAEDDNGTSEQVEESFPLPALAGRIYANPIPELSLEARLHVMALDVGDVDATYVDVLGTVAYRPIEWFGIVGGYRLVQYDFEIDFGDDEEAAIDLSLSGPFLGLMAVY